jgi:hypothetical protein
MMKEFNIAGPCNSNDHYMIEASTRLDGVEELIGGKKYFVIHAARQSGKTTYLESLTNRLNAEGKYYVLTCSFESVQGITDPEKGIPAIINCIKDNFLFSDIPQKDQFAQNATWTDYSSMLRTELTRMCKLIDKPLVIFFDEVDCLSEGTLISFLRQLRTGHNKRGTGIPFVHSIALVGMHNIRDYKAQIRPDHTSLGSSSPFNIVTESLTLKNFTLEQVSEFYRQHTNATGQIFDDKAIKLIFKQTRGQPWLVNAIAREVIIKILQSDYSQPITVKLVHQAIKNIIRNRPTHIDSLLERLKEEPVRRVIEPMIIGESYLDRTTDDFFYTEDLGLIRVSKGRVIPSNPIYAEIIVRRLSSIAYEKLKDPIYQQYNIPRYLKGGLLDVDYLLSDFQVFWRENSGMLRQYYDMIIMNQYLILCLWHFCNV